MTARSTRMVGPIHCPGLLADTVLVALALGPLAAPLLGVWEVPIPRTVSGVIYTIGTFVCPQPAYAVALYDSQLMVVCMCCYGTVLGLVLTRLWYALDGGTGPCWLPRYGVGGLPIFAALIFAYAAEFAGQVAGLWHFDNVVVTVAGLITGGGLGLMFHPMRVKRNA